jgi:hypothetical protein
MQPLALNRHRNVRRLIALSGVSLCGACAHNPQPTPATPASNAVPVPQSAQGQTSTRVADRGEEAVLIRNPNASRGWFVYGKDSHRLIAITDTIPDARGLFAVHFLSRKVPQEK